MRIGIITQPLKSNYGGILQNWALQQVLIRIGHEPITIDYMPPTEFDVYWKENLKWIIALLFIPSKRRPYTRIYYKRSDIFKEFVDKHIVHTDYVHKYTRKIIDNYNLDALIVGSDQVWRPKYNIHSLYDMYFSFTESEDIRKIGYAISFGTDDWEYSAKQTERVRELAGQIDHVSVREPSAIGLCKTYLNVEAKQVLDPTLLLNKEDYLNLIEKTERIEKEDYLAAYVLTPSACLEEQILSKATELGLKHVIINADGGAKLSVYQWLSLFRDAKYIITDSFHGSVFSLIFEKDFECVGNSERGNARFDIIQKLREDWDINEMRHNSLAFIKKALGKI